MNTISTASPPLHHLAHSPSDQQTNLHAEVGSAVIRSIANMCDIYAQHQSEVVATIQEATISLKADHEGLRAIAAARNADQDAGKVLTSWSYLTQFKEARDKTYAELMAARPDPSPGLRQRCIEVLNDEHA